MEAEPHTLVFMFSVSLTVWPRLTMSERPMWHRGASWSVAPAVMSGQRPDASGYFAPVGPSSRAQRR